MSGIPGEHDTYLCQLISDVPQLVCYHQQGMQLRFAVGKPSLPETPSQQPSEGPSPDLPMLALRFPAVLMLHRLAALAVTCATFPARTHEPAARPAPGSHAWIIR